MRQRNAETSVHVLNSATPDTLGDPTLPPITDGMSNPPAMRYNAEKEKAAPKPRYYRVTKGGRVLDPASKLRCEIRVGKELDDLNYRIEMLTAQGIQLEEIKEEDRAIGGFAI
jgi:hypothetical protein